VLRRSLGRLGLGGHPVNRCPPGVTPGLPVDVPTKGSILKTAAEMPFVQLVEFTQPSGRLSTESPPRPCCRRFPPPTWHHSCRGSHPAGSLCRSGRTSGCRYPEKNHFRPQFTINITITINVVSRICGCRIPLNNAMAPEGQCLSEGECIPDSRLPSFDQSPQLPVIWA